MLIAHATDLTGDDVAAFVHATALAAASTAKLVTVHGNAAASVAATMPDAGALAARWGRSVEHERRCHQCCDDVADTVIDALHGLAPELVVLGTHARHGMAGFARGSIGEAIARNVTVPALVVPDHARGFVDAATGAIDLRAIVIPAGTVDDATRGLAAARRLLAIAGISEEASAGSIELLHVGAPDPALAQLGVRVAHASGPIDRTIVELARARRACVIVMPTAGHDGIVDALLGSHTERVIRDAGCPVLAVPIRARAGSSD